MMPRRSCARAVPRGIAAAVALFASGSLGSEAAAEGKLGPDRGGLRPADAPVACSFAEPVCVHAAPEVPAWIAGRVLQSAERALSALEAFGVPRPLPDDEAGGSSALDVYLVPRQAEEIVAMPDAAVGAGLGSLSPRPAGDERAAFIRMPVPTSFACDLDRSVAIAIAEASWIGVDAAIERPLLRASAAYVASIVAPCLAAEREAIDAFQAHPERGLIDLEGEAAAGAMLFPAHLDERLGQADPGRMLTSLFTIASQKTEASSLAWQNEPDAFDALRSSLRAQRGSADDVLLAFAVDRAFVGNRSDGQHLGGTDALGEAGRVRFDWSVAYETLPRRLAPFYPVEPTGAAYVWLDLANAPQHAEVTFVAEWELPAVFRWSLVKIDREGAEVGRIDLAGMFGAERAERTIVVQEPLAGLIAVGTFTGYLDRSRPFDPDEGPWMPHGYEVTFYK